MLLPFIHDPLVVTASPSWKVVRRCVGRMERKIIWSDIWRITTIEQVCSMRSFDLGRRLLKNLIKEKRCFYRKERPSQFLRLFAFSIDQFKVTKSNLVAPRETIFGENLPLWQNIQSLGQFFKAPLTILQDFEPTLANFVYFWANFHRCHWTQCGKIIQQSGHTGCFNVSIEWKLFIHLRTTFTINPHYWLF